MLRPYFQCTAGQIFTPRLAQVQAADRRASGDEQRPTIRSTEPPRRRIFVKQNPRETFTSLRIQAHSLERMPGKISAPITACAVAASTQPSVRSSATTNALLLTDRTVDAFLIRRANHAVTRRPVARNRDKTAPSLRPTRPLIEPYNGASSAARTLPSCVSSSVRATCGCTALRFATIAAFTSPPASSSD